MRRITNYRSGDRAELLGVVLLQAFCAVAPIPRQEDFGLVDAVATLLRRDGRFVHAEDSFLVQFKSRTERIVAYEGEKFTALLAQEVSVFIGQVNLKETMIELHSLGPGLAHPNIMQAKGLVAHLEDYPMGLDDGVLHVRLDRPVLRWSTAELEDANFIEMAYRAMKEHLALERWNRAHRRKGLGGQIRWETNEVPSSHHEAWMLDERRKAERLRETVPSVQLLALHAKDDALLRDSVRTILYWLQEQGVTADPGGVKMTLIDLAQNFERLQEALDANPAVNIAACFQVAGISDNRLNFMLVSWDGKGKGGSKRYTGSLEELREQGFVAEVAHGEDGVKVTLGLTDAWLDTRSLSQLGVASGMKTEPPPGGFPDVLLLRRVEASEEKAGHTTPRTTPPPAPDPT